MRLVFFLLVLTNLMFFVWAQGYLGGQDESREPQRLQEQLQPEKLKVVARDGSVAATPPPQSCRLVEGLPAGEAEAFLKAVADSGGALVAASKAGEEATTSHWVHIAALPSKAAADKKSAELKQLGVTDFHVMQVDGGGYAISLGLFRNEGGANEFLQGLLKKGVKSARIETRTKPPGPARIEVRGTAELLAKRLPELLAGSAAASVGDCP